MDREEQEDEQRLREVMREWRDVGICCHDSPHDEAVDPCLRPFHTVSHAEFSEIHGMSDLSADSLVSMIVSSVETGAKGVKGG
jgi:hypothetical protein